MVGRCIPKPGEVNKAFFKKKLIGRAYFSPDDHSTVLAEIESVLNSRSLSYVSIEHMEKLISPSHLDVGDQILSLPDNLDYVCDLDDSEFKVTGRDKHLNNILNHFWKMSI